MLSVKSTYDQLLPALQEVKDYTHLTLNNSAVRRTLKKDFVIMIRRVNTAWNKVPAAYVYIKEKKGMNIFGFVVLKGSEGDSFAASYRHDRFKALVIHGHAIKRYIERHGYEGTLEQATGKLMLALGTSVPTNDSDTTYIYFDSGTFLCNGKGEVLHVRTYINNQQCHRNQRLFSEKSKMKTDKVINAIEKLL